MTDRELDDRLRAWYRDTIDVGEPAPIALRTAVASIPTLDRRPLRLLGSRRTIELLAAAALLVALLVAAALAVGSQLARLSTVTPSASTLSPVALVHAEKWSLSFDYPETWTLTDRGRDSEGGILGFVGNGSAEATCTTPTPQGSPTIWSWLLEAKCTTTWRLVDNSIVIRFESVRSISDWPPPHWTSVEVLAGPYPPDFWSAESLIIDGLPARLAKSTTTVAPYTDEAIPGASEVLTWGLPSQPDPGTGWEVVAAIRGPDVAQMEAQATAMVASIHFVPETVMLPTDPIALRQAGVTALAVFFADDKRTDCFPREVGSQNATISQIPFDGNPLTKPLPVTCTIESMEPNAMHGWTLVMSQSWEAGPDYPAGLVRWVWILGPDGSMQSGELVYPNLKSLSGPLYPHMGPSKYPG